MLSSLWGDPGLAARDQLAVSARVSLWRGSAVLVTVPERQVLPGEAPATHPGLCFLPATLLPRCSWEQCSGTRRSQHTPLCPPATLGVLQALRQVCILCWIQKHSHCAPARSFSEGGGISGASSTAFHYFSSQDLRVSGPTAGHFCICVFGIFSALWLENISKSQHGPCWDWWEFVPCPNRGNWGFGRRSPRKATLGTAV